MLEDAKHLHFIGIGGIGVSAVARIALGRGYNVSGSDVRQSQLTDAMKELGADVTIGQRAENIDGADLVIVSTAIPEHNAELVAAREQNVPILHRSDLLAHFVQETPFSVGVTGTHGKGSVSTMVTRVLDAAGKDPGFIIGGLLLDYNYNARAGGGEYIVAEVDESDGTHKNVPVTHMICNFLEADHLNYYKDLDEIIEAMASAVKSWERLQALYVNIDCDGNQRLLTMVPDAPVVTYGTHEDADWRGELISRSQNPIQFRAWHKGKALGDFEVPVAGHYNMVNALAAMAVAHDLGVSVEDMRKGLAQSHGLENRFTILEADGVHIVKDYNSHPTAMRKVLANARDLADGRIITIFKPYRYTLINYLKDEYATAFEGSSEVLITTMYAANEDPIPGVDTEFFVNLLREQGQNVVFLPEDDGIVPYLNEHVEKGDIIIFFGGDDFFQLADGWADRRTQAAKGSA